MNSKVAPDFAASKSSPTPGVMGFSSWLKTTRGRRAWWTSLASGVLLDIRYSRRDCRPSEMMGHWNTPEHFAATAAEKSSFLPGGNSSSSKRGFVRK